MKRNKPKQASQIPTMEPEFVPKLQQQDQHDCLALSCIGVNCVQFVTKGVKTFPLCQRRTTKITQIQFMSHSLKIASRMSQLLKT